MQAEVIAIGDELTSGQRLDTNSMWLSQRLAELGIPTAFHTTVRDELPDLCLALRTARGRAQLILCTGGLGPTADDLTRQALAEVAGVPLELHQASLEHIEARFARRGRPMPESNRIQAHFPAGARVVPNPHGTAPGIDMDLPGGPHPAPRLFAFPGVPAELFEMWQQTVAPKLLSLATGERRLILHRQLRCFGVGESDLEQMLPDLIRRGRTPTVGITVSQATITLRITAAGRDRDACEAQIEPVAQTIRECLGDLVFGEGDSELPDVVVPQLLEWQQTLATLEMATGGLVAEWLSARDPLGQVLVTGIVTRSLASLGRLLPWPPGSRLPSSKNDVDANQLRTAAELCRTHFAADQGLIIGPLVAGESNAPAVTVALATPRGVVDRRIVLASHPDIQRAHLAKHALNLLRLQPSV